MKWGIDVSPRNLIRDEWRWFGWGSGLRSAGQCCEGIIINWRYVEVVVAERNHVIDF